MELNEFIELTDLQNEQFESYRKLLLEWNEKVNLTTITDKEEIILKHFVDSLTINKYIIDNHKVIDVGTGAGFPGIPLKIYRDNIDVTLLDSLNKRVIFLNEIINVLGLDNIKAIHGRAEELARDKQYREMYDVAVSRAVANMSTLLEYLLPFVKVGGRCICMKGPNIGEELNNANKALRELGGEVENIDNFILPNSDIERNLIIIKKLKNTPVKYPRKPGTPAKEPI